jgi:hypothetical protein
MWAAMTRSLEMIVALFEYYSVSVGAPGMALDESSPSHENRYQKNNKQILAINAS